MATTTASSTLPSAASGAEAKPRGRLLIWLLVAALAIVPIAGSKMGLLSNFMVLQLSLMIVFSIAVLGLNLLTGFNGQISLGHGAFFALGAYAVAILIDRYNFPWWSTIPVSALICFVAGYLFGLPALRLEGHYLALATFSLAIAVPQILKYKHIEGLTGGVQGINLIKPDAPFGLPLNSDQWMYLAVLVVAVFMFWVARNLLDSRIGRALTAIRDHTMAASTMGINISQTKAITFCISALYVGVAGALHAIIFEFIAPDSFRIDVSIALLVGMVVGCVASLFGSVLGGIFVQVIEKYADSGARMISHSLHLPIEIEPWTIYGIVLILLVYVMPTGLAGGLAGLWSLIRRRSGS